MQADKERVISSFDGNPSIQILNGRYGPFIQFNNENNKKVNVKIPKDKVPKDLTKEDCLALWENHKSKINKSKQDEPKVLFQTSRIIIYSSK